MRFPLHATGWTLLLVCLTSCSSPFAVRGEGLGEIERDSAPEHIAYAQQEALEGDLRSAVRRLVEIRKLKGLTPEDLARTEQLLVSTAYDLVENARAPGTPSDELIAIYELELPLRLRATAGILGADRLIDEGHPVRAYNLITKLERKLPSHPMRRLAGDVMGRTGLLMIRKPGKYNWFFHYAPKGAAALEFLVLNYPSSRLSGEAYWELSHYYQRQGDLEFAQERLEDLLIYHAGSEFAIEAAARLPYLRLEQMKRDDYDRKELEIASRELDRWLSLYPDHELAGGTTELRDTCRLRLIRNDLYLARFYRRVDSALGARLHAERAVLGAREAGFEDTLREAQALLAGLPPEDGERYGVEQLEGETEFVPAQAIPPSETP